MRTMEGKLRTALVDDHPLFLDGLRTVFESHRRFDVRWVGHTRREAVEIAREQQPDLCIVDVHLPDGDVSVVGEIKALSPSTRVLVLSVSDDPEKVHSALATGAAGWIVKGLSSVDLLSVVTAIIGGVCFVAPPMGSRGDSVDEQLERSDPGLTSQEESIVHGIIAGQSNKEIARALAITEKTVKNHLTRIFIKLRVKNRVQAALMMKREIEGDGSGSD